MTTAIPIPLVRVGPVPVVEPPYDDERTDADLRGLVHARPARRVPATAAKPARPAVIPAAAPAPAAPSPREAIRRFVGVSIEVINGFRPPAHLRSLIEPTVVVEVTGEVVRRSRPVPARTRRGTVVDDRVKVRQIRICEPVIGVAEAAVVLGRGDTRWAMALRWEFRRGAWLCTTAQLI